MGVQTIIKTEAKLAVRETGEAVHQSLQVMAAANFTAPFRQPVSSTSWASKYGSRPMPEPRVYSDYEVQSRTYQVFAALVDCVRPDIDKRSYKGKLGMIGVGFIEIEPKDFQEAFAGIAAKINQFKAHPSLIPQELHNEVKEVVAAILGAERFLDLESALTHQELAERADHSRVWLHDAIGGALSRLKDPEVPGKHSDSRDLTTWGNMLNLAEDLKIKIGDMVASGVIDANVTKIIATPAKAVTDGLEHIEWGSWAPPLQGLLHGLNTGVVDLQRLEGDAFYQTKRNTPYHKGNGTAEFAAMVEKASDTFKSYIPSEQGELVPDPKINPADRAPYADIAFAIGNSVAPLSINIPTM